MGLFPLDTIRADENQMLGVWFDGILFLGIFAQQKSFNFVELKNALCLPKRHNSIICCILAKEKSTAIHTGLSFSI